MAGSHQVTPPLNTGDGKNVGGNSKGSGIPSAAKVNAGINRVLTK